MPIRQIWTVTFANGNILTRHIIHKKGVSIANKREGFTSIKFTDVQALVDIYIQCLSSEGEGEKRVHGREHVRCSALLNGGCWSREE